MTAQPSTDEIERSHAATLRVLDTILDDFGLSRSNGKSRINLLGAIPEINSTNSQHINMSLVGTVSALANAVAATQIFEARGGEPQEISIELPRAHNYLDPDIGMTPTLNGQEITLDLVAGNPFISGIYETAVGRHVVPSGVYVDLVYRWSTFLHCAVNKTAHAASVLQIMYTHAFEHAFVYIYANLGCASARLDPNKPGDRAHLWDLVRRADVWVDSHRDGALSKFGFEDAALHAANARLIVSHVRVYGIIGPWAGKPGFDMQGSAPSGMMALCGGSVDTPAWPPGMVINDYTTGYFGALAMLRRVRGARGGGGGAGCVVSPSLAGTATAILKYFGAAGFPELRANVAGKLPPRELRGRTGMGVLRTLAPLPVMSGTPVG